MKPEDPRDVLLHNLAEEVRMLQQLTHLQVAQIKALAGYITRRFSELGRLDRDREFELLEEWVKDTYDQHIDSLGKDPGNKGYAASVDLRADLPEDEQETWYRLS
jgi:hypothetical protein